MIIKILIWVSLESGRRQNPLHSGLDAKIITISYCRDSAFDWDGFSNYSSILNSSIFTTFYAFIRNSALCRFYMEYLWRMSHARQLLVLEIRKLIQNIL